MNNLPECPRPVWREVLSSSVLVAFAAFLSAMIGRWAAATPVMSPLTLSEIQEGKAVDGRLSLSISQQNFECTGKVVLAEISRLVCGDQRQAQVEFKSYNGNQHGVLAVYQSGRQQGYLMVLERQGNSYANSDGVVVLTPGFGSLNNFERYVYQPMKESLSEAELFQTLSSFMKNIGYEINISVLRDRVANKDYNDFVPKAAEKSVPPLKPETSPETETAAPEEEKNFDEDLPQDGSPVVVSEENTETKSEDAEPKDSENAPAEIKEVEEVALPKVVEPRPSSPKPKKTKPKSKKGKKKVIVTRGGKTSEVEVPSRYDDGLFGNSVPRRHIINNPRGYDLRKMTLKEIEELERRGLITRSRN